MQEKQQERMVLGKTGNEVFVESLEQGKQEGKSQEHIRPFEYIPDFRMFYPFLKITFLQQAIFSPVSL